MATQKCEDCGGPVSPRAKQCPHCGAPVKKKRKSGCMGLVALFLISTAVSVIVSAIVDSETTPPASAPARPSPGRQKAPSPSGPSPSEREKAPSTPPPQPAPPGTPDWDTRQAELESQFLPGFSAPKVGDQVALQLKGGGSQEGVIKSLTDEEIHIERGSVSLGFTKSQLAPASRSRCFAADYAYLKAHEQTQKERAAYEAKVRAEKEAREARIRAEQAATLAAARNKRIQSGFSLWDGSHIALARVIKRTMNDPKSYKHEETVWSDKGDHLIVRTTFRGKNAFGAVILDSVQARCDLDGNVLEIVE